MYLPTGMLVLYPCNSSAIQGGQYMIALTRIVLNAFTHDKQYEPIELYFSKSCGKEAPQGDDFVS